MIEDHLGEGLSSGSLSELSSESEGLVNGKVSLDSVHGSSRSLLLREDVSSLLVQGRVNSSQSSLGALNFNHVDAEREEEEGKRVSYSLEVIKTIQGTYGSWSPGSANRAAA